MNEFIDLLQNFGVSVTCLVALSIFTSKMVNKIIDLTERVTSAMVENSNNMTTLSNTIEKILIYLQERKEEND